MGETVTIIRRSASTVDDYGNPSYTSTTLDVDGCLIGWGATNEPALADSNSISTQMSIYFPAGTEIHELDEFLVRGEAYVKDGDPMAWSSMLNIAKGVVVLARRVNG